MNSEVLQTITKTISMEEGWKDNDNAGFTKYLEDVHAANSSLSSLFEDPNLEVLSMSVTMSVNVMPKE
jgi:hypothetical protein